MTTYEWGTMTDTGAVMAWTEEFAREQALEWGDRLVRREVGPWEPVLPDAEQAATDAYQEKIEAALTEPKTPEARPVSPVVDPMAALEASLVAARADREKIATALPEPGGASPM